MNCLLFIVGIGIRLCSRGPRAFSIAGPNGVREPSAETFPQYCSNYTSVFRRHFFLVQCTDVGSMYSTVSVVLA